MSPGPDFPPPFHLKTKILHLKLGSKTGWSRSNTFESEKAGLNPDSFAYYVILIKLYLAKPQLLIYKMGTLIFTSLGCYGD